MHTKYILIALTSIFLLALSSCGPHLESPEGLGSIYGIVTDFATGEPVANANVSLHPGRETTLTGYDGMYEFLDVPDGNYTITVSKAEYTDLVDDYIISVKNGRRMRRDVQIKKLPVSLRITDMGGRDITSLDFGGESYVTNKAFNIFNNGTVYISCSLVYSCKWIKSVTAVPNRISPGQTVTVNVEIDRSKLSAGSNSTDLYVISNNGSNVLTITATGGENKPIVVTLPVTDVNGGMTQWRTTLHAKVTSVGYPAYHSRGFCYSRTNMAPTISDRRVDVTGTGLGEYSYTINAFDVEWNTTYYVRAWIMYGNDNKVMYGETQTFYIDF